MATTDELLKEFYGLFGKNGGDQLPGNVGICRTAANVCHELMKVGNPILFDYFAAWDQRAEDERKPFGIERLLGIDRGQWEGAWSLAQLHYDQQLKQEAKDKDRLHKGHPLCNLALVGRAIGSPSLLRHYALLSSAGDLYWEHIEPSLAFGGYAPTILEQFESRDQQKIYRDRIRIELKSFDNNEPVYLEALLVSRWFSEAYSKHITNLGKVEEQGGKSFVEVLLDAVENPKGASDTTTGARFEAAAGILLSATPGFEVDSARKKPDEQVDLVVYYTPEPLAQTGLEGGPGLIECKSSVGKVRGRELRDFGAKCLFHRVKFGILVARAGTTGGPDKFEDPQGAELVRRRFQLDGLTLLVLDMNQLRDKSGDLRGLHDGLSADHKLLVFGPVA